jgi:2-dehydro-3-deoxygluconokinase
VDWVLLGQEEADLLTGEREAETGSARILEMGPSTVIVKLGADGALGRTATEVIHSSPFPVESVEATGAGDAFDAGFISGRLRGWDLAESLRLGNLLGALATTTLGDSEGLPTWTEVQSYLGTKNQPVR